jgi:hypothetical protein
MVQRWATGWTAGGLIPGRGFFSSPQQLDRLREPSSLLSDGYRGSFPGIKWQGREAD